MDSASFCTNPPHASTSASNNASSRIRRKRRPRPVSTETVATSAPPAGPSSLCVLDSAAGSISKPEAESDDPDLSSDTEALPVSGPLLCAVCGALALGFVINTIIFWMKIDLLVRVIYSVVLYHLYTVYIIYGRMRHYQMARGDPSFWKYSKYSVLSNSTIYWCFGEF